MNGQELSPPLRSPQAAQQAEPKDRIPRRSRHRVMVCAEKDLHLLCRVAKCLCQMLAYEPHGQVQLLAFSLDWSQPGERGTVARIVVPASGAGLESTEGRLRVGVIALVQRRATLETEREPAAACGMLANHPSGRDRG